MLVPAPKPHDLSPISGNHNLEGENQIPSSPSDLHMHSMAYTGPYTNTSTQNKVKKDISLFIPGIISLTLLRKKRQIGNLIKIFSCKRTFKKFILTF